MKLSFSKMSFIKLPKTRQFEYTPRHYDEIKERIEERKQKIAREMGIGTEENNENRRERLERAINFRAQMDENYAVASNRKASLWSNIRLIIILAVLLMACYYIYMNLDEVIASFAK